VSTRFEVCQPANRTRRSVLQGAAAWGLLGFWSVLASRAQANDVRVGQPAPAATLVTLDGKRLSTPQLIGQVVILTFWATWCVPCREELPLLSTYAAEHAAQGLSVLGFTLNTPDELDQVRAVARTLSFPVGFLATSSAPGYGRIWRIPVNFTIDRAGRLVDDGWKDRRPVWTRERLARIVTPLLEEK
jgi:cytochrome c biogenesis protein CcmG, thiol:disulfide interchange protein DsbE